MPPRNPNPVETFSMKRARQWFRIAAHLGSCLVSLMATAGTPTTITLANVEWPPFTSASLPDDGRISRRVADAFALEGIQVRYEFMPWKRAIEEARAGRYDGTLIWARAPGREQDFYYSEPVLTTRYVLFYAKSRPVHWNQLTDLRGLTIGGVLGATPTGEYGDLANAGVFKREESVSDELNLRKLAAGHLDAAAVEESVGNYLLANQDKDVADQLAYDPKPLIIVSDYLLISKKTPQGEALTRRFNQGLARLQARHP